MSAVLLAPVGARVASDTSKAPAGSYSDQKGNYYNGRSCPDSTACYKRLLGNLRNHVKSVGKEHVDIGIVSLGDGIALLQSAVDDKELAGRIDALKTRASGS